MGSASIRLCWSVGAPSKHVNKSSQRYERFCRAYVRDLNGTRACIAAGYRPAGAAVQATILLRKPKIRERIAVLQAQRAAEFDLSADLIVDELKRLGFSNMLDYMRLDEDGKPVGLDLRNLTRDQAAAIQEVTEDTTGGTGDGERRLILRTKFKLADKGANLERLGRHLGMFQDNVKITGLEGLADRLNQIRQRKHGDSGSQS